MANNRQPDLKPNHSSSSDDEEEEEEVSFSEDEQASDSGSEVVSDLDSELKPKHEPKKRLNPSSSETKESGSSTAMDVGVAKNIDVSRLFQYSGLSYRPVMEEEIVKAGLELVEGSKREELEEKWSKLKKQELQLYVQRLDLIKEKATLVFEAMKSSKN